MGMSATDLQRFRESMKAQRPSTPPVIHRRPHIVDPNKPSTIKRQTLPHWVTPGSKPAPPKFLNVGDGYDEP